MSGPPVCILFTLPPTLHPPELVCSQLTSLSDISALCSGMFICLQRNFSSFSTCSKAFSSSLSSQGNLALTKCTALLRLQFCPGKGAHSAMNLMPLGLKRAGLMLPAAHCCPYTMTLPAQGSLHGHVSDAATQCPCTEIPLRGA